MAPSAVSWGLLSALLVLSVRGDVPEEMSNIQSKAVQLVMENLHKKNNIRNGFRMTSLLQESEQELDDGLFVNLEIVLKQTKCFKEQWMDPECKPTSDGKSYNCVGCFKFDFGEQKARPRYIQCVPPSRAAQETIINTRRENCNNVKKPKPKPPVYRVGSVTFLRYRSTSQNPRENSKREENFNINPL